MNQNEAIETLRPMLRTGMTIKTSTDHGRGLTGYVRLYIAHKGDVVDITHLAAVATGARFNVDRQAISMGGCGYNKAFQAVYSLGRAMRPVLRCTGSRTCPSNDHVNEREADYRKGRKHSDGGYAFRQA